MDAIINMTYGCCVEDYVSNEILSGKKFLNMIGKGVITMGKEQNRRMMEYVMDQLSGLPGVRQIPMMGGYIFYYNERIFGGIYGSGEMLIKITETSRQYMPDSKPELPYEGTKEMLPCTILEDRETLQRMVMEMWEELPERKTKK